MFFNPNDPSAIQQFLGQAPGFVDPRVLQQQEQQAQRALEGIMGIDTPTIGHGIGKGILSFLAARQAKQRADAVQEGIARNQAARGQFFQDFLGGRDQAVMQPPTPEPGMSPAHPAAQSIGREQVVPGRSIQAFMEAAGRTPGALGDPQSMDLARMFLRKPNQQRPVSMGERSVLIDPSTGKEVARGALYGKEKKEGKNRRVFTAADGFKYYEDTGERVLPKVRKPAPKAEKLTLKQRQDQEARNAETLAARAEMDSWTENPLTAFQNMANPNAGKMFRDLMSKAQRPLVGVEDPDQQRYMGLAGGTVPWRQKEQPAPEPEPEGKGWVRSILDFFTPEAGAIETEARQAARAQGLGGRIGREVEAEVAQGADPVQASEQRFVQLREQLNEMPSSAWEQFLEGELGRGTPELKAFRQWIKQAR